MGKHAICDTTNAGEGYNIDASLGLVAAQKSNIPFHQQSIQNPVENQHA